MQKEPLAEGPTNRGTDRYEISALVKAGASSFLQPALLNGIAILKISRITLPPSFALC